MNRLSPRNHLEASASAAHKLHQKDMWDLVTQYLHDRAVVLVEGGDVVMRFDNYDHATDVQATTDRINDHEDYEAYCHIDTSNPVKAHMITVRLTNEADTQS